jgi:hypothetical protein
MWGLIYSNRKCNEKERIMQHKNHLQRIVEIKPAVKINSPNKPYFLFKSDKIDKDGRGNLILNFLETILKIQYENNLMIKKMVDLQTHSHKYHPEKIKIKECPALSKVNHSKDFKDLEINKENFVIKFILLIRKCAEEC